MIATMICAVDETVTIHPTSTVWQFATVCEGTVIGPHSVIGSCAWIGRNCVLGENVHIQHGAFIPHGTIIGNDVFIGPNVTLTDDRYPKAGNAGYLPEPPVLEDGCSIGAGAVILPGVIVGKGSVLSMGVFLSATTKIVNRATGEIHVGKVPPYSVVVPGNIGGGENKPSTYCAVIVKVVDERTRSKTSPNELLRT